MNSALLLLNKSSIIKVSLYQLCQATWLMPAWTMVLPTPTIKFKILSLECSLVMLTFSRNVQRKSLNAFSAKNLKVVTPIECKGNPMRMRRYRTRSRFRRRGAAGRRRRTYRGRAVRPIRIGFRRS